MKYDVTLFTISLVALLLSCQKDNLSSNEQPQPPVESKQYLVSLGMSGEITSIEESELTKATHNDLYGVQVYARPTNSGEYKPYAYGLFDSKDKMQIKLLKGYLYKFIATVVIGGKDKIAMYNNAYGAPLSIQGSSEESKVTNTFKLSNELYFAYIQSGVSELINASKVYYHPNIDRYYGEVEEYAPIDDSSININMKRVVFGVKFIAEGLIEGRLKIEVKDAPKLYITSANPQHEIEDIFSLENPTQSILWTQDDYSENIPVSISWEKADGANIPLVTQNITFKRKKLTTITIKVLDSSLNSSIGINRENGELIVGDNITIDAGTENNANVNPGI